MNTKYIIFDLDDTLVSELSYLKSAYLEIAKKVDPEGYDELYHHMLSWYHNKKNVFAEIVNRYPGELLNELLAVYRNHFPKLVLKDGAKKILEIIKSKNYKLGLISDGRSYTQRNKLKSLGIENFFDKIVISEEFGSEKPDIRNFQAFISPDIRDYVYIADNISKDFISPNKLGWLSICLTNDGDNIHIQNFDFPPNYLPDFKIEKLSMLQDLI